MTIKKMFVLILVAVVFTLLITSVAFAGGWHKIGPKEQGVGNNVDDQDAGLWPSSGRVPHTGLQTSTNNCRTCHAVHNADNVGKGLGVDKNDDDDDTDSNVDPNLNEVGTGQSFKLLRNEERGSECNFCHGPNGALSEPVKKPYADMIAGDSTSIPAKGEHTLGVAGTTIPDSTVAQNANSIFADGLSCGNCHSVHGGYTLNGITNAGNLATKILRRDPANNGDRIADQGAGGGVGNVAAQGGTNEPAVGTHLNSDVEGEYLAAFCGDCHNKNVSWDDGRTVSEGDSSAGGAEGDRPNKYAHPLGNTDGLIDVYGKLDKVEDASVDAWIDLNDTVLSCDDCHKSRRQQAYKADSANDPDPDTNARNTNTYGYSKFPHQSVGHKLLSDGYTDALDVSQTAGDPKRVLPNLDAKVCRTCHGAIGAFGGVGNPSSQDTF